MIERARWKFLSKPAHYFLNEIPELISELLIDPEDGVSAEPKKDFEK